MSLKKTIVYLLLTIVIGSLTCGLLYLNSYLQNVYFYQPLRFQIEAPPPVQSFFSPFGVTPHGRVLPFPPKDNNSFEHGFAFFKTIGIKVNEAKLISNKILNFQVNNVDFIFQMDSLKKDWPIIKGDQYGFKNEILLLVPENYYSRNHFVEKVLSIFHWRITQRLMVITFLLLVVLFYFLNFKPINQKIQIVFLILKKIINVLLITNRIIWKSVRSGMDKISKLIYSLANSIINVIFILKSLISTFTYSIYLLLRKFLSSFTLLGLSCTIALGITVCVLHFFGYTYIVGGYFLITGFFTLTMIAFNLGFVFFRKKNNVFQGFSLLLFFLMVAFLISEFILRMSGIMQTYYEINLGGKYRSPYECSQLNRIMNHVPNSKVRFNRQEFDYTRTTNSLGLCEAEIPLNKDNGEYRIIGLGDSYTEGMGVGKDSTWLKTLERKLNTNAHRKFRIINAGISGSDPFFEYILLKEKLLVFKPDLVILNINSTDIGDIVLRGGWKRFNSDGSVSYNKPPSWEWIYANLHIFRLLVHKLFNYNYFFVKRNVENVVYINAEKEVAAILPIFKKLSDSSHFRLLVVIQPLLLDVQKKELYELKTIQGACKKNHIEYFNMLDYFLSEGKNFYSSPEELYWPKDGHYNPKGCRVYARGIEEKLKEMKVFDCFNEMNTH